LIEIKADFTMDSYRVSDISGREVREHKVGSGSFILDLRDREPGVYLVEILARGSKITRKILIY